MNILKEIIGALITLVGVIMTGIAIFLIVTMSTSRTSEGIITSGLVAVALLALVTLGAVVSGFNRMAVLQASILEEAEEQSQLLRLIAKQGRTRDNS